MSPDDHTQIIVHEEVMHPIRSKLYNVPCPSWISYDIGLYAEFYSMIMKDKP